MTARYVSWRRRREWGPFHIAGDSRTLCGAKIPMGQEWPVAWRDELHGDDKPCRDCERAQAKARDTEAEAVNLRRARHGVLRQKISAGADDAPEAAKELHRRGTVHGHVMVSAHAIDRFSQQCIGLWASHRRQGEGIYTFLNRLADEAFALPKDANGRCNYEGICWTFNSNRRPVLVTVSPLPKHVRARAG